MVAAGLNGTVDTGDIVGEHAPAGGAGGAETQYVAEMDAAQVAVAEPAAYGLAAHTEQRTDLVHGEQGGEGGRAAPGALGWRQDRRRLRLAPGTAEFG